MCLLRFVLFANATNTFFSGDDAEEISKTLAIELDKLNSWFAANKLCLNVSNTNYMIFGNKKIDNNINICVVINGISIDRVYNTKCLGVMIDDKLNWKEHVKMVQSKTTAIYIYNSVLTCRQHIINSSVSAPPNATTIAVKKISDVVVCMFGPEL